jgi:hypothetical protein
VEMLGPERVIYRDGKEPPTVLEKIVEVVRHVDQIVLIPRWGIRAPIHVNSLIAHGHRSPAELAEPSSNVTPLKKAH